VEREGGGSAWSEWVEREGGASGWGTTCGAAELTRRKRELIMPHVRRGEGCACAGAETLHNIQDTFAASMVAVAVSHHDRYRERC